MSAFICELFPDSMAEFKFINRGTPEFFDYVGKHEVQYLMKNIIDMINAPRVLDYEKKWIEARLSPSKLNHDFLNPKETGIEFEFSQSNESVEILARGKWKDVTLVETPFLASVSEMFSYSREGLNNHNSRQEIWNEGEKRLLQKINVLNEYNKSVHPYEIELVEFGTRRRFSKEWQRRVLQILLSEYYTNPRTEVKTSNVQMAFEYELQPIGTMAHEIPMGAYALLTKNTKENNSWEYSPWKTGGVKIESIRWIQRWTNMFPCDVILPDTLTTKWLLDTMQYWINGKYHNGTELFGPGWKSLLEILNNSRGFRHDSGDPIGFGNKIIEFYKKNGIDPRGKTIVFSNNIKLPYDAIKINEYFKGKIKMVFAVGTDLTNDLGIDIVPSVVMKLNRIDGKSAVKISDDEGKMCGGDPKTIHDYLDMIRG
jgi:nicotinate phosphoribosyltransferase